jgi:DNA-binding PadR family transcriptional regulator
MPLSTTSYAVLSLLAVRPWSSYELAQQMDRSLAWFWPSAQSVVYQAPKQLELLGLVESSTEYTGRRKRTVYAITEDGRRALRAWFDEEAAGPRLEWEGLLKVAFGDMASTEQLRATLVTMRKDAEAHRERARARSGEYAQSGGPFPQRLPVIALSGKLLLEWAELVARWAAWAQDAVDAWDGEQRPVPPDAFHSTWSAAERS